MHEEHEEHEDHEVKSMKGMKKLAIGTALLVLLEGWLGAQSQTTPPPQEPQAPVFRSAVDVVAIDVQVVDRSGEPLKGLAPTDFDVSIDGKPRQIISVNLIEYSSIPPT
ncbi:MAG TPA: hypothetical protein VF424_16360, partial [Vicinamibacterales bacterium]